jgi:hypothetical protein
MTIRGDGHPKQAMVLTPRFRDWARRPGASPPMRMTASWSGRYGPTEYKVVARYFAPDGKLPSDRFVVPLRITGAQDRNQR